MTKNKTKKIKEFIVQNIDLIDKLTTIGFRILMFVNLFVFIYAIWNIRMDDSSNPPSIFIILGIQLFLTFIALIIISYSISRKDDQSKLNIYLFVFTSFVFSFSIPITYFILYVGRALSINSEVKIGSADGWLSFIGSFFGGLITMIAVIFTINHERSIRRKEAENQRLLRIQELMPILDFSFSINDQNVIDLYGNSDDILIAILKNESNAHAHIINLTISDFNILFEDNSDMKNLIESKNEAKIYYVNNQILAANSQKEIQVSIQIPEKLKEKYLKSKSMLSYQLCIEIIFSDIQNFQKYKYDLSRIINIQFMKDNSKTKTFYVLERIQSNKPLKKIK